MMPEPAPQRQRGRAREHAQRRPRNARVAYRQMPAATPTLRLSTLPVSGMPMMRSQRSRVRRRRPAPSAPSTHASAPPSSASGRLSPPASAPEHPDAQFLQFGERAGEVGDGDHGHRFRGPAGRLGHCRVDADGAVPGHDHRVRAERVGVAQAGPEVVRVGHPVQHQQQRRFREPRDEFVEGDLRHRRVDDRHDALVPRRAGEGVEPLRCGRVHVHGRRRSPRKKVAHPRVVAPRRGVDRVHRARLQPQPRRDGVETVQRAGGGRWLAHGSRRGNRRDLQSSSPAPCTPGPGPTGTTSGCAAGLEPGRRGNFPCPSNQRFLRRWVPISVS